MFKIGFEKKLKLGTRVISEMHLTDNAEDIFASKEGYVFKVDDEKIDSLINILKDLRDRKWL